MRAPQFWQDAQPNVLARVLAPLGALYGAIVARRMARGGWRSGVPVICIGNFTVGGAGKTPLAIAIARLLLETGEAPVFVSRGYGGARHLAPLRVDPAQHNAREVGDEPLLLARLAPTIVCVDRIAGARAAITAGASIIVMDDGMQNPALHKDLTLAAVDGGVGLGNGLCLPAGPLRAPLATQSPFVDAIVVIGEGAAGDAVAAQARGKPVFRARLEADSGAAEALAGKRVVAFAGIGRPDKFFETLRRLGAELVAQRAFPDHHLFTQVERDALVQLAKAQSAILVTTEKDTVRLPKAFAVTPVHVHAEIDGVTELRTLLTSAIIRARKPQTGG